MTPRNGSNSTELHVALAAVAVVVVTAIALTTGLLRLADHLGPQIGDIISFPAGRMPPTNATVLMVDKAGDASQRRCALDVSVMQRSGGSIVIEAMQFEPDRRFRVHWAGTRTSDGHEDCGGSVDLLLNRFQIATLVFGAGGTGVKAGLDAGGYR